VDIVEIVLTREPLDVNAAAQRVTCPEAGGVAVFLGTTRAEESAEHGRLEALDYHAYDEMAHKELRKLAEAARQKWPICRVAIWHRLGAVRVAEASVVVAVSCPHRNEAFLACAWLMDELKKTVPIWKKEVYAEGTKWQKQ
jgi:molybdopterin synthase catalytic subunit